MADKEIFLTNDKSSEKNFSATTSDDSSAKHSNNSVGKGLTTDEEVFLMNIDYFE